MPCMWISAKLKLDLFRKRVEEEQKERQKDGERAGDGVGEGKGEGMEVAVG